DRDPSYIDVVGRVGICGIYVGRVGKYGYGMTPPDRKQSFFGSRVGSWRCVTPNVASCEQSNVLFPGNGPKPV
ncbi:hypothetical protein DPMN_102382, partial [Dreissena polymorpha]